MIYFRTGPEIIRGIREVIRMMELPECICSDDVPWRWNEGYDKDNPCHDFDNPSNHYKYCPRYIVAYLQALADGEELPE